MTSCVLAFNGERLDPVSDTYHLGNGYRAYSPVLMRFTSPDSWSPFGAGGVNPYAYCAGDPVNRADPSGHMSWQAGLGIGLSILGILGAVFTGGASIAAAGSISAALAGASTVSLVVGTAALVADVTGVASAVTEKSNPEASAILGWVSLVAGIIGIAHSVAGLLGSRKVGSTVSRMYNGENIPGVASRQFRNDDTFIFYYDYKTLKSGERVIDAENGYVKNFAGTNDPAIILHGRPDLIPMEGGRQMDIYGMVDYLQNNYGLDLRKGGNAGDSPIHFIACFGDYHAQQLANKLKRTVISYGKVPVFAPATLQGSMKATARISVSRFPRVSKYFEDTRFIGYFLKEARSTIFEPEDFSRINIINPKLEFAI